MDNLGLLWGDGSDKVAVNGLTMQQGCGILIGGGKFVGEGNGEVGEGSGETNEDCKVVVGIFFVLWGVEGQERIGQHEGEGMW
jgi:hypothetical protein